ncbi:uncharacterized protein TNCV_3395821 [Trichonephila clavipes]|nr:uncharacterized protein TNCV_3395821 [Trichonephila clavipes]
MRWFDVMDWNQHSYSIHTQILHVGYPSSIVVSDADCCYVWLRILKEDMDVCKYIVPSQHGATLNSRRATSPLVRLMERKDRWEAPDHHQEAYPENWGENELNRSFTFRVLKATDNVRRHLALCHDEFRGA